MPEPMITPPSFPAQALQAAQDPSSLPQLFSVITEQLPLDHKSDWRVVMLMEQTLKQVVDFYVAEFPAAAERQAAADAAAAAPKVDLAASGEALGAGVTADVESAEEGEDEVPETKAPELSLA